MRINFSLGYLRSVLEDSKPYARMKLMVVGVQVLPNSVLPPKKFVIFEVPPIVPFWIACTSGADPDPNVFGPPGSGSISTRFGFGSGSFFCDFFLTFYL